MNLLGAISIRYSSMSGIEKKIADVILEDPQKVTDYTVTDLADASGVSRGSIVNFATSLGYKGFSQMKLDLARTSLDQKRPQLSFQEDEDVQVFQKVLDMASTAMGYTFDVMANNMRLAAEMLMRADKILVFAIAPSAYVAEDISYNFMRIGFPVIFSSEPIVATLQANSLGKNSVLIEVSEGGRTTTGLEVAKTAKNNGAKIISFTSSYDSPLYRISDISLVAVGKDISTHMDASIARVLYLLLAEGICTYITSKIGDEAYDRLSQEVAAIEKFRGSR